MSEAQQLASAKTAYKADPAAYKKELLMTIPLAFEMAPSALVDAIATRAVQDPAFTQINIDIINSDPKTAKQLAAAMVANPKGAAKLKAALSKQDSSTGTGNSFLNLLAKKVVGPIPVWGIGAGVVALLGGYLVLQKKRR
jgi:hypothetical protein